MSTSTYIFVVDVTKRDVGLSFTYIARDKPSVMAARLEMERDSMYEHYRSRGFCVGIHGIYKCTGEVLEVAFE